jgi:hypothetical protein
VSSVPGTPGLREAAFLTGCCGASAFGVTIVRHCTAPADRSVPTLVHCCSAHPCYTRLDPRLAAQASADELKLLFCSRERHKEPGLPDSFLFELALSSCSLLLRSQVPFLVPFSSPPSK